MTYWDCCWLISRAYYWRKNKTKGYMTTINILTSFSAARYTIFIILSFAMYRWRINSCMICKYLTFTCIYTHFWTQYSQKYTSYFFFVSMYMNHETQNLIQIYMDVKHINANITWTLGNHMKCKLIDISTKF